VRDHHLHPEIPRHLGVTFRTARYCDLLYDLVRLRKLPSFQDLCLHFEGTAEAHRTFVHQDPFDNLLELKHYSDPRMAC